ncbi:DUF4139 domain-containing protein [Aliiroseovarius subalbicans]|uniref:DUF4139 domain-containing protein n=1 Tax=Aliiroseovarius subalbicans TaxID=2925840 RepID=UPI001F57235B|nr:DUF4139 domain-containing protein [Aliiroseovarius subalbicans]MCI2399438.1 DUF4139 domain-containing protein [Aliiroseovarius subalbicans]
MRLAFAFALAATPLFAEDFHAAAPVTAATVFPDGALVTRTITLDLPAGNHSILVPNDGFEDLDSLPRITASSGVTIGTLGARRGVTLDPAALFTPAQTQAKAQADALEAEVTAQRDLVTAAQGAIDALEAQRAFITAIRPPEDGAEAATLTELGALVASQTGATLEALLSARQDLRAKIETLEELQAAHKAAQAAFDRLNPPAPINDMLTLDVAVAQAQHATITIELPAYAEWAPLYDLHLSTGDAPSLTLERKAIIVAGFDQHWQDIDLTLSTVAPSNEAGPDMPRPNMASIHTPAPLLRNEMLETMRMADEPMLNVEAAPKAFTATAVIDGVAVTYAYPRKITLGQDPTILTLDTLTIPVNTEVHASPRHDDTAFLMALFTNETGEPLLSGDGSVLRDEHYMGQIDVPLILAGGEATLPMGPIEGLRLSHTIARNETGDTGILTKSNTREQQISFSVENLTDETQELSAFYPLVFSEQEDLRVALSVSPQPDRTDLEDKRGVSAWDMTLPAGETKTVNITARLDWPEGQDLSWRP